MTKEIETLEELIKTLQDIKSKEQDTSVRMGISISIVKSYELINKLLK